MKLLSSKQSARRQAMAGANGHPVTNGYQPRTPPPSQRHTEAGVPRSFILGAVLVAVLAGVGVAVTVATAGDKVPVIFVDHLIEAGQPLHRSDLTTKRIAADGVDSVSASAKSMKQVVGKTATITLIPGLMLTKAMYSSQPALPPGSAQVGLIVQPGQYPQTGSSGPYGLRPGDTVMVVLLAPGSGPGGLNDSSAGSAPAASTLVPKARVLSIADLGAGSGVVVSVAAPVDQAAALAQASSAGRVALVKVTG